MFSTISFAQDKIVEFNNTLKTTLSSVKDIIPIVNKENGEVSIFITDAEKVYGYKFDNTFKIIDRLASEEKRRKYKVLIGSSILNNGDYQVYLTNKAKKKYAVVSFSYNTRKSIIKEFKLVRGEKFIQTVSSNNKFYLITGDKIKRELYVNTFSDNGAISKHKVDLSCCPIFINKSGTATKVTDLLIKKESIKEFEYNTPNSIEAVSEARKMYVKDNTVIFTFDENKKFTQVLEIDLKTFKGSKKDFIKPL